MQTATIELRNQFFVTGAEHKHAQEGQPSMAQKFRQYVTESQVNGETAWSYVATSMARKDLNERGIIIKRLNQHSGGQRSIEMNDGSYYSHPHWQM